MIHLPSLFPLQVLGFFYRYIIFHISKTENFYYSVERGNWKQCRRVEVFYQHYNERNTTMSVAALCVFRYYAGASRAVCIQRSRRQRNMIPNKNIKSIYKDFTSLFISEFRSLNVLAALKQLALDLLHWDGTVYQLHQCCCNAHQASASSVFLFSHIQDFYEALGDNKSEMVRSD